MNKLHQRYEHLLLKVIDGAASAAEEQEFFAHIQSCPDCRKEYGEFQDLEQFMSIVKLKDLSEDARNAYWHSLYNRLERGIGWVLLSLSVILLLGFAGFMLIKEFITNPTVSVILKIGVCGVLFGLIALLVSVLKERLFIKKYDKYSKEVKL